MHLLLTMYFCSWCILFSNDVYSTFTLSILTILLQWFYGVSKMEKYHIKPFQYCLSCKKMTPQHYIHCRECSKCVPVEYVHTLAGCMSEFAKKRYMTLLYIIFTYIMIIVCLWSFFIHIYAIGILVHCIAIYSTFKQKNINRDFVY